MVLSPGASATATPPLPDGVPLTVAVPPKPGVGVTVMLPTVLPTWALYSATAGSKAGASVPCDTASAASRAVVSGAARCTLMW